jgi:hypothetical protein
MPYIALAVHRQGAPSPNLKEAPGQPSWSLTASWAAVELFWQWLAIP